MFIGPSGQSPELTLNAEDDTQCYNGQNMLKLPGYMYAEHISPLPAHHCRPINVRFPQPLPAHHLQISSIGVSALGHNQSKL